MATPKPKHITTVCSLCGLDWDSHGDKPTTEDCIRLLLTEVQRLRVPSPYVMPYRPQPYPVWYWSTTGNTTSLTPAISTTTLSAATIT